MDMLVGEITEVEIILKTALSGMIALQIVQNPSVEYFSHIFLDLQMPIMDGYSVARQLR